MVSIRVVSVQQRAGKSLVNRDREGRLVEECCCIQPLGAEQNQAFLMEVFILCSVVWSILIASVSVFTVSSSAACSSNRHKTHAEK